MTFTIPRAEWVSDDLVADRGEHAGFQMFTKAGNDACANMVLSVAQDVSNLGLQREAALILIKDGVKQVGAIHPEVHDTEPEWAIVDAVNLYFDEVGFTHIGRDDLS